MKHLNTWILGLGLTTIPAFAAGSSLDLGREAILRMSGCFQVDYSYSEVEAIKPGYELDPRVYDATKKKPVKEYLMLLEDNETQLRLQRILFMEDETGEHPFIMKHHGENWTFEKEWQYEYMGDFRWEPVSLTQHRESWTREVTSLDDGLRYHCTSPWTEKMRSPEWQCSNFAPIPGRETRDMGRKDYNSLQRTTRIISYSWGWLERQENVKVIYDQGVKTELAREAGKIFSIRLPDEHCDKAKAWAEKRQQFWQLTREVWQEFLNGNASFAAYQKIDGSPLYAKIWKLESEYYNQLDNPETVNQVKDELRALIESYRK